MKILNTFITSIACFRRHFDFHGIWCQLGVFLRDMSPNEILYPDDKSELLYEIIKNPDLVEICDNQFVVEGGEGRDVFTINTPEELKLSELQKVEPKERIRILAIFELGEVKIENQLLTENMVLSDSSEIMLSNGRTITVVGLPYEGPNLKLRKIMVDPKSISACYVDGVEIKPGKFAYGVFSQRGLHKVLRPVLANEMYRLILTLSDSGEVVMIAKDLTHDSIRRHVKVTSFCMVGKNNYAYIDNGKVYSAKNAYLDDKLRRAIGILDNPLIVESNGDEVIVTMKNGNVKHINL